MGFLASTAAFLLLVGRTVTLEPASRRTRRSTVRGDPTEFR